MKDKLELYIHIPFCVKKCMYCDFLSFSNVSVEQQQNYLSALMQELESARSKTEMYEVQTIFIGGGTPSYLQEGNVASLFGTIRSAFRISESAEITIECNPGTLNRDKLEEYKACGINRLSFGLQSANNDELKRIGRIHNYEQFVANYKLAREVGFRNINVDIMSALPGQDLASYGRTLAKVIELQPEHISSYSLIVEEGTPLAKDSDLIATIPNDNVDRKMYEYTKKLLKSYGYERYEISNYAKKGYECRHNIGYWTLENYLGFGLGAASCFEGSRFHNTERLDEYLSYQYMKDEDVQAVTKQSSMEEYMFLGLRLSKGVSKSDFQYRFGQSIEEVYGSVIQKHKAEGLLIEHIIGDEIYIALTDMGINISNYVSADFLLDNGDVE